MVKCIAEFCQNHNGDYGVLKEMIHQAAEAGCVYGKIQTIFADDLTRRERFEEGVSTDQGVVVIKRPYQSEYDRLKKLEITLEQHHQFIDDCRRYGLIPLTTCFTRGSVNHLSQMGWKAIKVASYDCGSLPLLADLAGHFEYLIVSTGASKDEEIGLASNLLKSLSTRFALLHCVTIYPTPLTQLHLRRMEYLKQFTDEVGLSDHTLVRLDGVKADVVAVFLGAKLIERHFTILEPEETRDGPVSVRADDFAEIVRFSQLGRADQWSYIQETIPEYESMLGEEHRELSSEELLNRDYYRGRFATHREGRTIYNWEDTSL